MFNVQSLAYQAVANPVLKRFEMFIKGQNSTFNNGIIYKHEYFLQ